MKRLLLIAFCVFGCLQSAQADLTLYTDRPTARLQPAATRFEQMTGEKVVIVEAAYGQLLQRLESEGANTPADLLFTKDLVYLHEVSQKGLLQPMQPSSSLDRVASFMRHPQNLWVAVTFRARTLVYDPSRVTPDEISSYDDLADSKWAGRLCLRTSKGGYNEALTSFLIETRGVAATKTLLQAMIDNLATVPFSNDTSLLESMAAGMCDVGIVNHYYLAGIVAQNPNFPVKILFLDQNKGGVHTNGAGIGIVKASKKQVLAQRFVEMLLTDEFQLQISGGHLDYPAVEALLPETLIRDWGTFKKNPVSWDAMGAHVPTARQLFKEVGYN